MKKGKKLFLACLILILAGIFVYLPSWNFEFLTNWDDGIFIQYNPRLEITWENLKHYILNPFQDLCTPLPMYSFMLDKLAGGLNPTIFRFHNILLHLAAGCFLLLCIRRTGVRIRIAFVAALLWTIHPQKVESVVWITERKDVLCGALAFASFWFFLRARAKGKCSWTAGILGGLSVFAKPASITLPFLMVLYEICMRKSALEWKSIMKRTAFPLISGIAAMLYTGYVTAKTNPGKPQTDLLIPFSNLFRYPLTAVFPYDIHPIYPTVDSWGDVLFPLCAGLLFALFLIAAMRKADFSAWKIFLCFAAVGGSALPVLGFLEYTNFHFCDRYNYLVSATVWGLLALTVNKLLQKNNPWERTARILAALCVVFYIVRTEFILPDWKNDNALAVSVILRPGKPNIKALDFTATAAMRSDNLELFRTVRKAFADHINSYHNLSVRQKQSTLIFLSGYEKIMEGKKKEAWNIYRPLRDSYLRGEPIQLPLGDGAWLELLRELAVLTLEENRKKDALSILEAERRHRIKNGLMDGKAYLGEALIAEIKGDKTMLLNALEKCVKAFPDSVLLRKKFEEVKKNPEPLR